jgi:HPt (histidine-containing phosphotransfer) domain-containing protein
MSDPVDLTHLRELTSGDVELEKSLFELFMSDTESCINGLEDNCTGGENIPWKKHAHALKGSTVNIGAQKLSDLCSTAQESFVASSDDKIIALENIKSEYTKVKQFLEGLH